MCRQQCARRPYAGWLRIARRASRKATASASIAMRPQPRAPCGTCAPRLQSPIRSPPRHCSVQPTLSKHAMAQHASRRRSWHAAHESERPLCLASHRNGVECNGRQLRVDTADQDTGACTALGRCDLCGAPPPPPALCALLDCFQFSFSLRVRCCAPPCPQTGPRLARSVKGRARRPTKREALGRRSCRRCVLAAAAAASHRARAC